MNQFDLTYKRLHTKTAEYTFLSRAHGTLTILWAIKQTLKSAKEQKSHQLYFLILKKLSYKLIKTYPENSPIIFGN